MVKKPDLGTFIVGQVFQQRGEGLVQQRYQPNFKNLIWEHAQGRTVEINAFGKYLKEYIPEDNLTDTRIEHKTNSDCMSEDAFWALMYVLIIKPEMGKEMFKYELNKSSNYFFLVRMGSKSTFYKAFHVHLRWSARDSEWVFDASSFNSSAQITWGHVYLYPDPDDGSLS